MKINREQILSLMSSNKNLIIGAFVLMCMFGGILLLNRGTYSVSESEVDTLKIICPETASAGDEIECSIELNSVTMATQGLSSKYNVSEGLTFVSFTYTDTWKDYVNDSDGFVLVNLGDEGVAGSSVVGTVKYMVPTDAGANNIYKVELVEAEIGDGDTLTVTFDNVYDEVRILSDINTLDSLTLSDGTLNETFDKNVNDYTATTDSDKLSIEVVKTDENATISGDIGEVNIHYGTNIFNIVVTSEIGVENTYVVSIYREYDFSSDKYAYNEEDNYIYTNTDVDSSVILNNISIPSDLNRNIDNNKLVITYGEEKLLEIDVLNIMFNEYRISDKDITVSIDTTVGELNSNMIISEGLTYKVFNGDVVLDSSDILLNEMILKIYYGDNELDSYNIKVDPYSLSFNSNINVDEENKYIKSLGIGTTIGSLLDNVNVTSGSVVVNDSNGEEKDSNDVVATGDKLIVYSGTTKKEEYTLSVVGDVNGDGLVNGVDLVILRKHIVEYKNPDTGVKEVQTGVYELALDISGEGTVNSLDVVRIRKKIVGLE